MIEIKKTDVFGWESAIRGMRNPMNSWDKSDSVFTMGDNFIGETDLSLMKKLVKAGSDHSKFMRMINVTCDITAPLYWWKEYDTYKVGTVANSCSTMHKIHDKEFTLDDFSHEHLLPGPKELLVDIIDMLNAARVWYLDGKNKDDWWQMIQLLPTSYNQKRTVQLNYAVLRNMYHSRKNHKLDEWHVFCKWIEGLPYSEIITLREKEGADNEQGEAD
jgi:hypothetical protein